MRRITYFLPLVILLGLIGIQNLAFGQTLSADDTFQSALENNKSGTASTWHNPDEGQSGSTMPLKTFQTADGVYCREFQQTIIIDGKPQQGYGTACRQPDGTWQIVNPSTLHRAEQPPTEVTHVHVYEPAYPYAYAYPYPYWYFPGFFSFSFGYEEHGGHYYDHDRHFSGGHDRHWGHSGGGWRSHR